MVLPLLVLNKPSSTGCAMACATSTQLAQALLDQGSSLYVCSHQSVCVGFVCSQSALGLFPCPRSASAFLCGHCPFPLWWLWLPCCSCSPAESKVLCLQVSAFDPKQFDPFSSQAGVSVLTACVHNPDLPALCSRLGVLYVTWLSLRESVFLIKFAPFLGNG